MQTNYKEYIEIFLVILFLLFLFCYSFHRKDGLPTKWPVIGMLPALLKNQHRIHDYTVEVLEKTKLTFLLEGPWFTNMKLLGTVDPANVHHILSKNFGNYPRGSKFKEISEVLAMGFLLRTQKCGNIIERWLKLLFLVEKVWEKIESGLIPFLDHASDKRMEIHLQDLFGRFLFDTISTVVMGHDPGSLSIDLPNLPFLKALHDFEESKACKVGYGLGVGLMTIYIDQVRKSAEIGSNGDKFLRDTILAFLAAGRVCEALRLHPPVPFNIKVPIEPDTLPSGHKVDSSMQIIFNMYAMGRMRSLWGEDCYEFKPERWILETGKIRHVPSHQFLAFSTGPRTCVGKHMALTMIKAVAIAIISRYHIEPVQTHPVVPENSMVLYMKQGLKVKVAAY
ncbi:hypothetical protein Cgig2_033563 [Carnegiea gigantea]|uniref:Cytochrome P450 n=1 Tax=Carnegiea gigantea TaxID=171969 RepID=A0A9Q1KQB9_9CARY|nr:hypothetical protein Cgig2_033563 [Carnegiea gigantea]